MSNTFQNLLGIAVEGTDGAVGALHDALVDLDDWSLRYFVVSTADWLPGGRSLLAAEAATLDSSHRRLRFPFTREQIRSAPSIDQAEPISRRQEWDLVRHFGWNPYWSPGPSGYPTNYGVPSETIPEEVEPPIEPCLQSARHLLDYDCLVAEGAAGKIDDLLLAEGGWSVRCLIVRVQEQVPAQNTVVARRVLLPPAWVERFDWERREAHLRLSFRTLVDGPAYDPALPLDAAEQAMLQSYYDGSARS